MDPVIRAPQFASLRRSLQARGAAQGAAPVGQAASTDKSATRTTADQPDATALLRAELQAQLERDSKAQCDAALESARQRGFDLGVKEGREAAQKTAAQEESARHDAVRALVRQLSEAGDRAVAKLAEQSCDIAFESVCRIAGTRAASREFVAGVVENVLTLARGQGEAVVRLHPRDAVTLRGAMTEPLRIAGQAVQLVEDETLAHGGCVVVSELGTLDGSLEVQLRRLRDLLSSAPANIGVALQESE
jgi:flagellar assembly protein FliH